jgi:hypothetical protein
MVLTGAATALAIGVGTTAALAATTWTVNPGGTFNFTGTAQVKDVTTPPNVVASCSSVKMTGTAKKGSGQSGTGLGTITKASFSSCKIATLAVSVAVKGLPWKLNAASFNKTTGVTTGSISGIELVATGPGCKATLDGTGAGKHNGVTQITYTNSTGKIALLGPGGNLHSYGITMSAPCLGLIKNNDAQQASGSGTVSPKQTITSP